MYSLLCVCMCMDLVFHSTFLLSHKLNPLPTECGVQRCFCAHTKQSSKQIRLIIPIVWQTQYLCTLYVHKRIENPNWIFRKLAEYLSFTHSLTHFTSLRSGFAKISKRRNLLSVMLHYIVTVFSIAIIFGTHPTIEHRANPFRLFRGEKCLLSRKPKTDFSVECVRVLFKCGKVAKQFGFRTNKLSGKRTVKKNGSAAGDRCQTIASGKLQRFN